MQRSYRFSSVCTPAGQHANDVECVRQPFARTHTGPLHNPNRNCKLCWWLLTTVPGQHAPVPRPHTLNSSSPQSSRLDCLMRQLAPSSPASMAGSSRGRQLRAYASTKQRPAARAASRTPSTCKNRKCMQQAACVFCNLVTPVAICVTVLVWMPPTAVHHLQALHNHALLAGDAV